MVVRAKITGLGSYLPKRVLSNADLEKMVDTSDEWIVSRTGMKERRIAGKEESTSSMGYMAAVKALDRSSVLPESIDLIIVATVTPDYGFPSTACLIQSRLGASRAVAVDIQAACTGMLYALSSAKAYVEVGMYDTVLVVASEKLSSIVDYTDRNTCILFGDGASACVVSGKREGEGLAINRISLGADGIHSDLLILPGGGSTFPATEESVKNRLHYLRMEGKEIFKQAVRRMESAIEDCLRGTGSERGRIDRLVPHQANIRIIEALARRLGIGMDRVFVNIGKYGNTSASSVGIALDELMEEGSVRSGDHIVLCAFGAGLTWGAATMSYEVED
ncbi:MAG: ketoacyl-ACP synthase III [Simkaniaceae bacterium]|nr:ketoacyl-ACP synthase III [Simkaniaceae bacterium]